MPRHNIYLTMGLLSIILCVVVNSVHAHEISGRVWLDSNADGLQSSGEPGIPNTNIELYPVGSAYSIARTVSDQNGRYSFVELDAGFYYLCNDEGFRADGLEVTIQDAGDDSIDNDFDWLPCTHEIEINAEQDGVADLGLVGEITDPVDPPVDPIDPVNPAAGNQIIGRVWRDSNGDGLQSIGEPGIAGINVEVYPVGSNASLASLLSNTDGSFVFTGLSAGQYYLCNNEDFRALGLDVTLRNAGDDSIDNDFDYLPCSEEITVSNSQGGQSDFGLIGEITDAIDPVDPVDPVDPIAPSPGNQITGRVWLDSNGDGLQSAGEPGIAGINVEVYPVGSNNSLARLHSNDDGSFSFTGLSAGQYYLCNNEDFREQGLDVTLQNAGDDSIDNDFDFLPCSEEITVTDSQGGQADLGLIGTLPANNSVSGIVILRSDSSENHQPNENSAQGQLGFLSFSSGNGQLRQQRIEFAVIDLMNEQNHYQTLSDYNGNYEFNNIHPGEYKLCLRDKNNVPICFSSLQIDANSRLNKEIEFINFINLIHVNENCTLQQAAETARIAEQVAACNRGHKGIDTIVLEQDAYYESMENNVGIGSQGTIVNTIYLIGNGATISSLSFMDRATLKSSLTAYNVNIGTYSNIGWKVFLTEASISTFLRQQNFADTGGSTTVSHSMINGNISTASRVSISDSTINSNISISGLSGEFHGLNVLIHGDVTVGSGADFFLTDSNIVGNIDTKLGVSFIKNSIVNGHIFGKGMIEDSVLNGFISLQDTFGRSIGDPANFISSIIESVVRDNFIDYVDLFAADLGGCEIEGEIFSKCF